MCAKKQDCERQWNVKANQRTLHKRWPLKKAKNEACIAACSKSHASSNKWHSSQKNVEITTNAFYIYGVKTNPKHSILTHNDPLSRKKKALNPLKHGTGLMVLRRLPAINTHCSDYMPFKVNGQVECWAFRFVVALCLRKKKTWVSSLPPPPSSPSFTEQLVCPLFLLTL